MSASRVVLIHVLASFLTAASVFAQPAAPVSQLERDAAAPLSQVEVFALPEVDNEALLDRDELRMNPAEPEALQFAEPFDLAINPESHGTWEEIGGYSVWRLVVSSPNAFSINAGFSQFQLPEGAALWLYPAGAEPTFRAFTSRDHQEHGQLWTPIVPGDEIVIELNLPGNPAPAYTLELGRLSHAYRPYGLPGGDLTVGRSGSCNVDVICPQGDGYRDIIRSVATYSRGGSRVCSAVAVNNTAMDGTPLVLTAHHCGMNGSNAPSMVVYWNYENSTCRPPNTPGAGGPGNGSLAQFSSGATFRGSGSPSDWALVELNQELDPEWEVFLAGWDRRNQATSSAIAIHHPRVQEKRISFEYDPTQITNYLSSSPSPTGTHIHVIDWDLGTTEPGSSGSPLFSPEKRVVGQLHGGYAACSNNLADWYGRIYHSMNTGLAQWLDPGNTGVQYIDGLESGIEFPELPEVSMSSTRAMAFDGAASLTAGPSPFFPREDDLSVSLWAQIEGPGVLVEMADEDELAFRLEVVEADGDFHLRYTHHGQNGTTVSRDFDQVALGEEVRHIAVTRGEEPAAVRVFVDGRRVGQPFFYNQSPATSAQRTLHVGNSSTGDMGVTALLDEVRLFQERLTVDVLLEGMHRTYAPDDKPGSLVAYFRFEADSTGFAYDFSNSGSSGEVTGDNRVASPFPVGEAAVVMNSPAAPSASVGPDGLRLGAQVTSTLGGANMLGLFVKHVSDEVIEDDDLPAGVYWRSETVWGARLYGEVTANLTIEFDELSRHGEGFIVLHREGPLASWTDVTAAWEAGPHSFTLSGATSFGEWAIGYGAVVGSEEGGAFADAYRLEAPFPNPLRDTAGFELAVRDAQDVRVELFDALGRRVAVLFDDAMAAGSRESITIDASALPSGMYVVRAAGRHFTASHKVIVVR